MRISQATGYALAALAALACLPAGTTVPVQALAAARGLPERYLARALSTLVRAGIVASARAVGGGFRLARPARDVSLLDVVEALQGPVRGEVVRFAAGAAAARLDARLNGVCEEAAGVARRGLSAVSLADLAGEGD